MHRQTDAVPSRTRRSLVPAACLLACLAPVASASADPPPASPPATAPAAPPAAGDLALNASGSAVLALQRTLFQLGLPVARDGRFGAATDAVVRRYQHEEGQPVTGVVTRAQRTAMRRKAAPRRRELAFASRSLRVGASGTDVRAAQRLLIDNGIKTPTHGAYTTAVRSRVQRWERQAKMRADGVLSPAEARLLRKTAPAPPGTEAATPKSADDAAATGAVAASSAPAAAASTAVTTTGGYTFPIQGPWRWGGAATLFADRGGAHQGVDVFAACGTPLVAASSGTVAYNQFQSAAGNYVVIRGTPTGEDQGYMHLKARSPLAPGTPVSAGTPIGEVGDTGNADGCHLHFELWSAPGWYAGGAPRDPKADLTTWATQSGRPPSTSAR